MAHDIAQQSFWSKFPRLHPYALLARWDRPIGIWLLYWPCVWSLSLAPQFQNLAPQTQLYYFVLFFIGAILMRGAGCTVNDLADRKLDTHVERTKNRPLASGALSVRRAVIFLALQCFLGAVILFQLSPFAILLGLATLPMIAAYPFMKRITWWPQAFLGLTFNAGALIGWAAIENRLSIAPILLYVAGFFWTIAYDTVYAHIDSEDDALIGIKSTALRWGGDSKTYIGFAWVFSAIAFAGALLLTQAPPLSYGMLFLAFVMTMTAHSFWNPMNRDFSLAFFRLQSKVGFLLALAALAPVLF